jgi:hypothetical protein
VVQPDLNPLIVKYLPSIPHLGIFIPNMGIKPLVRAKWRTPERVLGPAEALFTATQRRVLGLLFAQPERSYYTTELIGLAGAGSGAVQRELARLAQSGLVTVRSIGNQRHYQANPESPLFDELRGIMQKVMPVA